MRQQFWMTTACAAVLVLGASMADAQQNGVMIGRSGPSAQVQDHEDHSRSRGGDAETTGQGGMMGGMEGRGTMSPDMMGGGMMGRGMMGPGMMDGANAPASHPMAPVMMRMMFALMDADGDGTISLQEFQAAHERIFKAVDANRDGKLTPNEMSTFMHGRGLGSPQQ